MHVSFIRYKNFGRSFAFYNNHSFESRKDRRTEFNVGNLVVYRPA